jgi:hypothetical protein
MGERLDAWWDRSGPVIQDILGKGFGRSLGMDRSPTQQVGRQAPAFEPEEEAEEESPWVPPVSDMTFFEAEQAANEAREPGQPAFDEESEEPAWTPGGGEEEAMEEESFGADQPAFEEAQTFPVEEEEAPEEAPEEPPVRFSDVHAAASPEARAAAIDNIETMTSKDINQLYAEATGNQGGDLTKDQKAELLMEFGLRLMATPANAGDAQRIGAAGAATLGTYQKTKEYNRTARARALEKTLDAEVQLAQIDNYRRAKGSTRYSKPTRGHANGVQVLIFDDGTSVPIVGVDGKPLPWDENKRGVNDRGFEFQAKKAAYEAIHCEGLTGDAARACEAKALNFASKGDKESEQRFDLGAQIRKELNDPDNTNRYPRRENGKIVKAKWKELSAEEQDAILRMHTDRAYTILSGESPEAAQKAPAPSQAAPVKPKAPAAKAPQSAFDAPAIDLTEEEIASIPEGKSALIENDDGTKIKVRKVNGNLELVQ